MNTCKNYSTDGGNTWVIGGKLKVESGANVEGVVTKAATVEKIETPGSATAEACATKINAMIDALIAADLMEAPAES